MWVLGRMYDYHVLDMAEFGVENFKSITEFKASFFYSLSLHSVSSFMVTFRFFIKI